MWRNPPGILICKMIRVLVFLCMAILPFARCSKIHEHMTREEMLTVFQAGHESVPAYEVVPVLHTVHRRSPEARQEVHLKAFGKDYNLALTPNDGLWSGKQLAMWTVDRNDSQLDGLHYQRIPEEDTYIGDIYQDTGNMASILLHQDASGKVLVDGNIGSDLVIRPLPERVVKEVVSKVDELHEPHLLPNVTRTKRSLEHTSHHVVYKKPMRPMDDEFSDFAFMEPDHLSKRFRSKRSVSSIRSKREAPYVIYPEILCIVDYDGYRLHGGDNVQIKRYFVSFWNGVDLRYKLLKGPKIRISIAGIIISRGRDATPYLERNRVGRDAIDSAAALTDMGKYLFRERRLPVYDIAVAVTKLDMCRRQYANDVCNRGTAGFAYVGGACVVNKRLEKVNSVAIIEDTGGFSGIIVAAHEVGHLLGAVHDGSPPPSYLGGPGAEKCRWEDGYIMSDLRHTEKGFKWSHCSVSSFHHFLNGDTATCLYNAPHEDEALPRVLPGKLLSLDAQCRKDRGTSACFKDDRVCAQLFCFDAGSGYCVAYRPAAEGSPCGDGQYCLNGKCVAEHENIIPDYTQNVPTYVRRENLYNAATQSRPLYTRYNTSTTEYRYPWDSTTRSTYQSKYKYTTPYSNTIASTTTTTASPSLATSHYTTASTPYTRYTHSTVSNFITDDYNKKYSYSYNNDYNNNKNNHNAYTTATTRRTNPYDYSRTYNSKNSDSPNDVSYVPKVTPYRYKTTVRSTSLATTSTNAAQYGPQTYGHETEAGECQDVGTDCAELIDRLRTWLCHLQSVKSRCCASLKTIC
ncbi:A disintegrin and metalloproteinase with thrombospondin motifs 16-like isoform X3 [Nasonia vitripennis]|nr:A disintegrin and metalloproteinase with thrombospondin motifs 16-like isoform X3 [Nasonia vitripennis]XP_008209605.1 A disintegrin and metalloproteinase with thrombospondin motifs 16-like isoform X3 [Nasonia vitripennis]XP_016838426.1 A disintegrin and metalloproteinase with thrombospondin motifs 16-like isoform X3 [Nasonia vitripennis]XP_016838428.1 A disintegrin and metalloproteinase with thrombospondin motifs 16-like isoform X3 [Nasonia vitripennis]XP_016838430.1 A disintegrin and metall